MLGMSLSLTRGNSDTTNVSFNAHGQHAFAREMGVGEFGVPAGPGQRRVKKADQSGLSTGVHWKIMNRQMLYAEIGYLRDRFKDYDYASRPVSAMDMM